MRKNPWCVKLSSFELTTSVQTKFIRKDIEAAYSGSIKRRHSIQKQQQQQHQKQHSMILKNSSSEWHEKYTKMSKIPHTLRFVQNHQQSSYLKVPAKFWQYNVDYRQQFSLFHYQAPELLTNEQTFVFPTKRADVYSLTILLWEILNSCVPFVIYNQNQMEELYINKEALLPIFEKDRCSPFMKIFEMGLEIDPSQRSLDLEDIVSLLEEVKFAIKSDADELIAQQRGNTLVDCDYESVDSHFRFDPNDNLMEDELERNVYENVNSISHIDDDISMDKDVLNTPINQNNANHSITTNQFNQFLFNSKDGERSSTLKKDRKTSPSDKKSVKNLFEKKQELDNDPYWELNRSLNKLSESISLSRDDFHKEYEQQNGNVIGPIIVKENELPKVSVVQRTNSQAETQKAQIIGWKKKDSQEVETVDGRTLKIVEKPSIPATTVSIADRNKMRRNAWLLAKSFDDEIENCNNLSQLSSASKRLNVSIRIVHNQITPEANPVEEQLAIKETPAAKETINKPTELENKNNERLSSSLNFQNIYSFFDQKSTSITNNLKPVSPSANQTHRTTLPSKISNLHTSQLSSTKMDNSYFDKSKNEATKNGHFEKKLWNREKEICNKSLNDALLLDSKESSVVVPKWTSVKDTIDQFEHMEDAKNKTANNSNLNKKSDETDSKPAPESPLPASATLIKRTLYRESIVSGVDLTNLDNIFERKTNGKEHKTMVTLNLRKSLRRASDISFEQSKISSIQKQPPRPSLCPNDSRMCAIQTDEFGQIVPNASRNIFPTATKYICAKCEANLPLSELRACKL